MTTREENELMCHTGPGTPGGNMMRRYWLPIGLTAEQRTLILNAQ